MIKGCCTVLLLLIGLMGPSLCAANSSKNAQVSHLELFFSQIMSVDEYRNYKNLKELNRVSAWIKGQMQRFGIPCQFQVYVVNNLSYRNVICSLDTQAKTKMVMGAHYDVFSARNGADNNASGVAGLLETARLLALQKSKLKHDVEFAFYTLEEPPFFKTEHMGSYMPVSYTHLRAHET